VQGFARFFKDLQFSARICNFLQGSAVLCKGQPGLQYFAKICKILQGSARVSHDCKILQGSASFSRICKFFKDLQNSLMIYKILQGSAMLSKDLQFSRIIYKLQDSAVRICNIPPDI
jgi:hypothetical protein